MAVTQVFANEPEKCVQPTTLAGQHLNMLIPDGLADAEEAVRYFRPSFIAVASTERGVQRSLGSRPICADTQEINTHSMPTFHAGAMEAREVHRQVAAPNLVPALLEGCLLSPQFPSLIRLMAVGTLDPVPHCGLLMADVDIPVLGNLRGRDREVVDRAGHEDEVLL